MNIANIFKRHQIDLEEAVTTIKSIVLTFLDNEELSWEVMGLSHVETIYLNGEYLVTLHATRPAIIIGRKGAIVRKLASCLAKALDKPVKVKSLQHNPFK